MTSLENALTQSFNDEYSRYISRPISTSESTNISRIFTNITSIGDCLICCDDTKVCIKCFKCTALYCKECLIKIASDFNKCSSCSINIKTNYDVIKKYNGVSDLIPFSKDYVLEIPHTRSYDVCRPLRSTIVYV